MRSNYIDDDTARMVCSCLDVLKIYKLMYNRKLDINYVDAEIRADMDDMYYMLYEVMDSNIDAMFDTRHIDVHEVNNKEDEMYQYFSELGEAISYDDEMSIQGIAIRHEAIMEFYKECDKFGVDVGDTLFVNYISDANSRITYSDCYESYMEVFVPASKEVRDKYGICFFYTDPTLFTSGTLEYYYDAIDFCDGVVCDNIKDEKEFKERVLIRERRTNQSNNNQAH